MSASDLARVVQELFANDRGLLAMDESVETCNRRFSEVDIPQTKENRHAYRDWIIRTPKLSESIGGVRFCSTRPSVRLRMMALHSLSWP